MKKLLVSVVVATASLSFNADAALNNAKNVKFVGDTDFASFCQAAVNDDLSLFKRSVAQQVGVFTSSKQRTLGLVLENVSCNGKSIEEFSETRQATTVIDFIKSIK